MHGWSMKPGKGVGEVSNSRQPGLLHILVATVFSQQIMSAYPNYASNALLQSITVLQSPFDLCPLPSMSDM